MKNEKGSKHKFNNVHCHKLKSVDYAMFSAVFSKIWVSEGGRDDNFTQKDIMSSFPLFLDLITYFSLLLSFHASLTLFKLMFFFCCFFWCWQLSRDRCWWWLKCVKRWILNISMSVCKQLSCDTLCSALTLKRVEANYKFSFKNWNLRENFADSWKFY